MLSITVLLFASACTVTQQTDPCKGADRSKCVTSPTVSPSPLPQDEVSRLDTTDVCAGESFQPTRPDWMVFCDREHRVVFEFPSGWKTNPAFGIRFDGESGFVQIDAADGPVEEGSLERTCQDTAHHKLNPYGSSPAISYFEIDRQRACLITPSADQLRSEEDAAAAVTVYPLSVPIGDIEYEYFLLHANKKLIEEIASSVRFLWREIPD